MLASFHALSCSRLCLEGRFGRQFFQPVSGEEKGMSRLYSLHARMRSLCYPAFVAAYVGTLLYMMTWPLMLVDMPSWPWQKWPVLFGCTATMAAALWGNALLGAALRQYSPIAVAAFAFGHLVFLVDCLMLSRLSGSPDLAAWQRGGLTGVALIVNPIFWAAFSVWINLLHTMRESVKPCTVDAA